MSVQAGGVVMLELHLLLRRWQPDDRLHGKQLSTPSAIEVAGELRDCKRKQKVEVKNNNEGKSS